MRKKIILLALCSLFIVGCGREKYSYSKNQDIINAHLGEEGDILPVDLPDSRVYSVDLSENDIVEIVSIEEDKFYFKINNGLILTDVVIKENNFSVPYLVGGVIYEVNGTSDFTIEYNDVIEDYTASGSETKLKGYAVFVANDNSYIGYTNKAPKEYKYYIKIDKE